MKLGEIREIWRYPVKSMQGERLDSVRVGPRGLPGDRGWAIRDEKRGEIVGAKLLGDLMRCAASYLEEPGEDSVGPAEITLEDGTRFRSDAADASERLSRALGTPVTLWPLQPADRLDHYRRRQPLSEALLRSIFALEPGEPAPDLSGLPEVLREFTTPPGTYFDGAHLLLLTCSSLDSLQCLVPDARVDVRRFRPNFLIDTAAADRGVADAAAADEGDADWSAADRGADPGAAGASAQRARAGHADGAAGAGADFPEQEWPGTRLCIGELVVKVSTPCVRCVMTTREFADLPRAPGIMRALVRHTSQRLGVNAEIETPGRVRVGDAVERIDQRSRSSRGLGPGRGTLHGRRGMIAATEPDPTRRSPSHGRLPAHPGRRRRPARAPHHAQPP